MGRKSEIIDALATFLLSATIGYLGVDRFYRKEIAAGILKLITFGGLGIWYIIDIIIFGVRLAKLVVDPPEVSPLEASDIKVEDLSWHPDFKHLRK